MAERGRVLVLQSGGPWFEASTLPQAAFLSWYRCSPEFKCKWPTGLPPVSWDFQLLCLLEIFDSFVAVACL